MMLQVPKWRIFAFDDDDFFFLSAVSPYLMQRNRLQFIKKRSSPQRQKQKWIYGQESKKWLLTPNLVHYILQIGEDSLSKLHFSFW